MKNLFLFIAFLFFTTLSFAQSQVWVDGYYRSNGTYVQGHYRTAPDHTVNNNWTTQGNTNPHTGKAGTLPRSTSYPNTYYKPVSSPYTTPTYSTPARSSYSIPSYSTSTYVMPVSYPSTYTTPSYSSQTIYTGPRGGTYYINSNGNKTYVR
jgi:hypothetical protein